MLNSVPVTTSFLLQFIAAMAILLLLKNCTNCLCEYSFIHFYLMPFNKRLIKNTHFHVEGFNLFHIKFANLFIITHLQSIIAMHFEAKKPFILHDDEIFRSLLSNKSFYEIINVSFVTLFCGVSISCHFYIQFLPSRYLTTIIRHEIE